MHPSLSVVGARHGGKARHAAKCDVRHAERNAASWLTTWEFHECRSEHLVSVLIIGH
jgi:hypothetical protein